MASRRCDAAVLYLQRGGFGGARPSLASVAAACAPHLRPGVPAFTKPLGRGRRRRRAPAGARRELRHEPVPARRRGRRPSARAGRRRARGAPGGGRAPVRRPRPRRRPPLPGGGLRRLAMRSDGEAFLGVAAGIAHRIAGSAVWSDGRCNWMGRPRERALPRSGQAAVAALGPDLYEGTSGVALFLAEAAARLDEPRLRATALGAIRLSLEQAGRLETRRPLRRQARRRLRGGAGRRPCTRREDVAAGAGGAGEGVAPRPGPRGDDVMGGRAGSVIGLVALARARAAWPAAARRRAASRERSARRRAGRGAIRGGRRCTTCADTRTARPASATPSPSCSARPARTAIGTPPSGRSPTSARGSTRARAPGRTCAASRAAPGGGRPRAGGRLVVQRRRRDRPGAPARARAAGHAGAAPRRRPRAGGLRAARRRAARARPGRLLALPRRGGRRRRPARGRSRGARRAASAGWASSGTAAARRASRAASPAGDAGPDAGPRGDRPVLPPTGRSRRGEPAARRLDTDLAGLGESGPRRRSEA